MNEPEKSDNGNPEDVLMQRPEKSDDADLEPLMIGTGIAIMALLCVHVVATHAMNGARHKLTHDDDYARKVLTPASPKPTNNLVSTNSIR